MAKKTPKVESIPIKKDTREAISFFHDKRSAASLVKDDSPKKLSPSGYVKTMNDKFFDYIETDAGKHFALIVVTAAITAIAYWVIKTI